MEITPLGVYGDNYTFCSRLEIIIEMWIQLEANITVLDVFNSTCSFMFLMKTRLYVLVFAFIFLESVAWCFMNIKYVICGYIVLGGWLIP